MPGQKVLHVVSEGSQKCDYDCEVRKVRSPETLLCLDFYFLAPPPSLVIGSSIILTNGTGSRASSGCRLGIDLLRHLFGTVVRQTQAHDGQHHGYLVDSTVLWLRLHLTCYLPLEETEVSRCQPAQSDDHVC